MNKENGKRVLLVRLGSMGDIVHTLPALATLKENFPQWEMDWLVESRWRPLLEGNPHLSRIMELDTLAWRTQPLSPGVWSAFKEAIEALRERRYDGALDFQGALKSAVACYLSGAREVTGFAKPWVREPACAVFYTRQVATKAVHAVDANLALARGLGAERRVDRFLLPEGDAASLPDSLRQEALAWEKSTEKDPRHRGRAVKFGTRDSGFGVRATGKNPKPVATQTFTEDSVAVLNPGAGWRSKCWSAEGYGAVADVLAGEFAMQVVINSGPGEQELAGQVRQACRTARPLIFSGGLEGLIALLRRARLVVGSDTGPLHLAAALGVPTVGLYGPTDPRRNGAYGGPHKALRPEKARTSHKRSPPGGAGTIPLSVGEVVEAVRELLGCGKLRTTDLSG